jgi:hypothetical protein
VGLTGTEATAYLPAFVAPFIATNSFGLVAAMATSFTIAFLLTFLANLSALRSARARTAADA